MRCLPGLMILFTPYNVLLGEIGTNPSMGDIQVCEIRENDKNKIIA